MDEPILFGEQFGARRFRISVDHSRFKLSAQAPEPHTRCRGLQRCSDCMQA